MLNEVIAESGLERRDLDCIAFGNGPGAFTGVRIAAATAQGLAVALGVPLAGVSTLAILAQHACDELSISRVQTLVDARMDEIYAATFELNADTGLVETRCDEALIPAREVDWAGCCAVGSGVAAAHAAGCTPDASIALHENMLPHATALARLAHAQALAGRLVTPDQVQINYLRNRVAWRN